MHIIYISIYLSDERYIPEVEMKTAAAPKNTNYNPYTQW